MNISFRKSPKPLTIIALSCLLMSCGGNKLDVDVSEVQIDFKTARLEKDIFLTQPDALEDSIPVWNQKYGEFLQVYSENVILSGDPTDSLFIFHLFRFRNDPNMNLIFNDCMNAYPDIADIAEGVDDGMRHYRYYYSDTEIPSFYSCISGFNYPIITTENAIAVCLDMYLGDEYEPYQQFGLPKYQISKFRKENIVPDVLKAFIYTKNPYNFNTNDLVSQMIYNGRILYMLDALAPQMSDSLKCGYTSSQWEWCIANEASMWAFYLDKKLLFSTNTAENNKFLNPAPFTSAFSRQSPGEAGIWTGWQIVRAFMERNADITIPELMKIEDAHMIFNKSKYKPRL
ncbi:MAG: hypothetical protein KKA07_07030 [Bacteroidetes bacterium]|nr:hypothetical protein [Bacteroidota bacterium]MBU1718812.1 hypothetical protein [Bacteroidota bacterium]